MLDALVRVVLAQVFTSGRVDPAALANLHTVWQCCEMRSNYGGQPVEERASKQDLAFWKARACQAHVRDGACSSVELVEAEHVFECCAQGARSETCADVLELCMEEWADARREDAILPCSPKCVTPAPSPSPYDLPHHTPPASCRAVDDDMIEGCDYDACAVELDWLHAAKGRTDLQKHCGVRGSELLHLSLQCTPCRCTLTPMACTHRL